MSHGVSNQFSVARKQFTNVFFGTVMTVLSALFLQVLFFGINSTNKLKAEYIGFKDNITIVMRDYKDITSNTCNLLRENITKNDYQIKSLSEYLKKQDSRINKQSDKMDSILKETRDMSRIMTVTMTKLEMQGNQVITIQEDRNV